MRVEVVSMTPHPIGVISRAAGMCYGKTDESIQRLDSCYRRGHMSVFEHAGATFRITGISRACSHQLVRHRIASYNQESQRYCKIDVDSDDWYVTPPSFNEAEQFLFEGVMSDIAAAYNAMLTDGLKPEDARYILPEACKTKVTVTMNLRELYHFLDTRQDPRAQWEIRELAHAMEDELAKCDSEWQHLMSLRTDGGKHEQ